MTQEPRDQEPRDIRSAAHTSPRPYRHPHTPPPPTGSVPGSATGARRVRAALVGALTVGVLALVAPAVAAPLAPAKPCPTGRYWEPHNKVCVPMSPPLRRH